MKLDVCVWTSLNYSFGKLFFLKTFADDVT
jgi:hypothetical protein